ncbi:MAG: hypothetical protein II668_05830 [Oscillospiraceae bacterium]|nr:hypothetical protein [Oscillospiraceae bacterium]
MKKLIITALCLVCALGLCACSDTADAGDTTKDGVIGDGFRDDLNDMKNGLEDMLDGEGGRNDNYGTNGTYGNNGTNGTNGTTNGNVNGTTNGTNGTMGGANNGAAGGSTGMNGAGNGNG